MEIAAKSAAETLADNDDPCHQLTSTEVHLQSIKKHFASLLAQVQSAMETQQINVADVHQFLGTLFDGDKHILPVVPDLTRLFTTMSELKLWHYDHYALLKKLVETFLPTDESIGESFAEYRSALSEFYSCTKISDFIKLSKQNESMQKHMKDYHKITMTLRIEDPNRLSGMTLDFVDILWKMLMKELSLSPPTTVIEDIIIEDRLRITWLILPHTAAKIKASYSKALRFYQKQGIEYVSIGQSTIYDMEYIEGSTPLYQASFMGNADEVEELLKGGASVNQQNENRWRETAIFGACQNGHDDAIKVLIDHGADIDQQNMYAETPLNKACYHGKLGAVSMLVKAGAKIDMGDMDCTTGLMWASNNGHTEIVKFLLEANANFNITDNVRWTALFCAARYGHADIVKMLVDCGSVVDHRNKFGVTPLTISCSFGNLDVVMVLLKAGARTDILDSEGLTCLMRTSSEGFVDVVKALLEAKADPNTIYEDGETAIFFAARNGHVDIVKLLIENGAAVDHRNKEGLKALDVAKQEDHQAVCEVLTNQETQANASLKVSLGKEVSKE